MLGSFENRECRSPEKADSYSFGMVLVAMMRLDKTLVSYVIAQAVKKMGRQNKKGVGIGARMRGGGRAPKLLPIKSRAIAAATAAEKGATGRENCVGGAVGETSGSF